MNIHLTNTHTGQTREAKIGFSWTTLFFSFIPAFVRGDIKYGFIQLFAIVPTMLISVFVFPFIYNKLYIKDLISNGYTPSNEYSKNALISKGFYIPAEANVLAETNS